MSYSILSASGPYLTIRKFPINKEDGEMPCLDVIDCRMVEDVRSSYEGWVISLKGKRGVICDFLLSKEDGERTQALANEEEAQTEFLKERMTTSFARLSEMICAGLGA